LTLLRLLNLLAVIETATEDYRPAALSGAAGGFGLNVHADRSGEEALQSANVVPAVSRSNPIGIPAMNTRARKTT
jgi:hypothetical protein